MLYQLFPNKPRAVLDHIVAQNPGLLVLELTEVVLAHEYPLEVYRLYEAVELRELDEVYCEFLANGCDYEATLRAMTGTEDGGAGDAYGPPQSRDGSEGDGSGGVKTVLRIVGVDEATAARHWTGAVGSTIVAVVKEMRVPDVGGSSGGRGTSRGTSRVQGRGPRQNKTAPAAASIAETDAQLDELLNSEDVGAMDREFAAKLFRVVGRDLGKWLTAVEAIVAAGAQAQTWREADAAVGAGSGAWSGSASGTRNGTSGTRVGASGSAAFKIVMLQRDTDSTTTDPRGTRKPTTSNTATGSSTSRPLNSSSNSQAPSTVDLHGQTVSTASSTASAALDSWWSAEMSGRIQDGQLHKFHTTAVFVPPLRIITGRGIHSDSGYSRIKVAIRRHLDSANYVYHEESWGMVVTGRRGARY